MNPHLAAGDAQNGKKAPLLFAVLESRKTAERNRDTGQPPLSLILQQSPKAETETPCVICILRSAKRSNPTRIMSGPSQFPSEKASTVPALSKTESSPASLPSPDRVISAKVFWDTSLRRFSETVSGWRRALFFFVLFHPSLTAVSVRAPSAKPCFEWVAYTRDIVSRVEPGRVGRERTRQKKKEKVYTRERATSLGSIACSIMSRMNAISSKVRAGFGRKLSAPAVTGARGRRGTKGTSQSSASCSRGKLAAHI